MLGEATPDSYVRRTVRLRGHLDREVEVESAQRRGDPRQDVRVGGGEAQDPLAVAALGVEDPGQEALDPFVGANRRPADEFTNGIHPAAGLDADGVHLFGGGGHLLEDPLPGRDAGQPQILLGPGETLVIDQCHSEAMVHPAAL